jgi:hypothetical protein
MIESEDILKKLKQTEIISYNFKMFVGFVLIMNKKVLGIFLFLYCFSNDY